MSKPHTQGKLYFECWVIGTKQINLIYDFFGRNCSAHKYTFSYNFYPEANMGQSVWN